MRLRTRTGATVIAVRRKGGELVVNPGPGAVLDAGDETVLLGTHEQVSAALAALAGGVPAME